MEFCNGGGAQNKNDVLLGRQKCEDMCIRLDTKPALDRQTDGRTELVTQYRSLHAVHDES